MTSGTSTKLATMLVATSRDWRAEASTCAKVTFSPIDSMIAPSAVTFNNLMAVALSMARRSDREVNEPRPARR